MDMETMRQQLVERVRENYADYRADLLLKDRQELVDGAGRIARTTEVFKYFTEGFLSETEVEYLLKFQDPLELVTDCWERELDWPNPNWGVLGAIISDIDNKRDYELDYPLVKDGTQEKPSGLRREERIQKQEHKPSIKKQLAAKPVPGKQPAKPKDKGAR